MTAASPLPHGFVGGPEHRDRSGRLEQGPVGAAGPLPTPGELHEVESTDQLLRLLERGGPMGGLRLQGLDLTGPGVREALLAAPQRDLDGLVVLGGALDEATERHLRAGGAVVFPSDPHTPVPVFRAHLYTPEELYAGLEDGYATTPDARAYAWLQDTRLTHDAYTSLLRAIHDDSMSDALVQVLASRDVVGVMGGHALERGTEAFAEAARLGHTLAQAGLLVATGGGPGAMEAANLGARATTAGGLERALAVVAEVPSFRPDVAAWAQAGLRAARAAGAPASVDGQGLRSVGVPTWFYGHEPPNVFADLIAKLFSNALREDILLAQSNAGVVVLPGAAGTVQEVFQIVTRLYYAQEGAPLPPLVLVDRAHWTRTLPVWPLLQALGTGRAMAGSVHLVDSPAEAAEVLSAP